MRKLVVILAEVLYALRSEMSERKKITKITQISVWNISEDKTWKNIKIQRAGY